VLAGFSERLSITRILMITTIAMRVFGSSLCRKVIYFNMIAKTQFGSIPISKSSTEKLLQQMRELVHSPYWVGALICHSTSLRYTVAGVLFPSILLIFSVALTGSILAYMQFIYSSLNIHLIFDLFPLC